MLFGGYSFMACENHFNCSDRGQCRDGVCVCQVQFAGENCTKTNVGYTGSFAAVFFILCVISITQLAACIHSEFKRLKHPTVWAAFRVTTQKLLHGVVIVASTTRVLYFALQGVIPEQWLIPMESAYHPLLITGLSLVVCYWSEAFFLETVSVDASRKARFLSKSAVAFAVFNVLLYVMLTAHFIATGVGCYSPGSEEQWLSGAFQASFAILLFIVYVVFLAIGVEIFFKLRGAFAIDREEEPSSSARDDDCVNTREVFKSRLALIFQALLTLLTVLCVIFDAVGSLWKYKVNSSTRSIHEIIYRIAEAGAVLWFPCVLWNTNYPERLWFLNPRCLLRWTGDVGERLLPGSRSIEDVKESKIPKTYNTFSQPAEKNEKIQKEQGECWICYDPDREDAGPFITPCLCKGGMSQVHHNCLRTWLTQRSNVEKASCKVCKHRYSIQQKHVRFGEMLCQSKKTYLFIPAMVVAVAAPVASVLVFMLCNSLTTPEKVLVLGVALILEFASFKIFGINYTKLYQVTRVSALKILNYRSPSIEVVDEAKQTLLDTTYAVIDESASEGEPIVTDPNANFHDSLVLVHASE